MKKLVYKPFVMLLTVVGINGYSEEVNSSSNDIGSHHSKSSNYSMTFGDIGIPHNEGLDFKIDETKLNNSQYPIEVGRYARIDYLSNPSVNELYLESYDNFVSPSYIHEVQGSTEFQTEMQNLIEFIELTVTESNENAGQDIYNYAQEIYDQIPNSLTNEAERYSWQVAVDIMGHSALYWQNETENGAAHTGMSIKARCGWWCRLWNSIKPVIEADVVGAVYGFGTGFIRTGTWQGAGIGALAGGVGASAGAAIKEIF